MPSRDGPTAILLMALGGPASIEEVEPYLREVRGGRPTPEALIGEFRERYRRIGGRSPIRPISEAQARALEALLRKEGREVRVFVGMRHWHPFIRESLEAIAHAGIRRAVGLCLTPYQSALSVGAYFRALEEGQGALGEPLEVIRVESWNDEPALVTAFASRVDAARARMAAAGHPDPYVLFTAHSLPQRIRTEGDPYEGELAETMGLISDRLPGLRKSLAYQSAGRTPDPWLGPAVEDLLPDLARQGESSILVVPFGFLSDNLEILYDIDVEFNDLARRNGLWLERTESLNADPLLVEAMAAAVRPSLDRGARRGGEETKTGRGVRDAAGKRPRSPRRVREPTGAG